MKQLFITFKVIFFAIIISLYCNSQPALAHRPHDVIDFLQVSPSYDRDKTVFIVVRDKFLRSIDGGSSWQTIARGIDNRYDFSSLTIAKKDSKVLLLSTDGDGIYKSQDGGNSWNKTNNNLENLKIRTVVISPDSNNLFLALGAEGGLYQTQDGGEDWTEVIPKQNKFVAIGFSSDTPAKIAIADDKGDIYLSQDRGNSWQNIASIQNKGSITNIILSPNFSQDKTLWIGTEKGGVLKTVDRGNSFVEVNRGITDKNIRNLKFVINNDNKLELFTSTWDDGCFRSDDGGENWRKYDRGLTKDHQADEDKFNLPHFSYLEFSPQFNRDNTLFLAGFNGLFKSTNGGKDWQELETLSTRVVTSIAVSPNYENDSTIAIGQYEQEGYISNDRGISWKDITDDLDVPRKENNSFASFTVEKPRFFKIAFSPNYAKDKTIFSSLIYRFIRSTNGGKDWQNGSIPSIPKDVPREIMIAVSPNFAKDKTIYLATYRGSILNSTNGGQKFSIVSKIGHEIGYLSISPDFANDKTLYAAGEDIYKSIDGGKTWQIATENLADNSRNWSQVVISPNYKVDQTVIAGSKEGLFKTTNTGKTWELLDSSSYWQNSPVDVVGISPDYQNDQTIIVSVKGKGLFKSIDGGETFKAIGKDLLAQNYVLSQMVMSTSSPLQFSPAYAKDKTIYGFGSAKAELFKSTNGGATWEIVSIANNTNKIDNFMTDLKVANLFLTVYPTLKFLLAAIIAFFSYLLLGFLQSTKKLPSQFNSQKVKLVFSFLIFIAIPIVLFLK
jgi:photosystem II stability/assembly factor-like uncharacterized protein